MSAPRFRCFCRWPSSVLFALLLVARPCMAVLPGQPAPPIAAPIMGETPTIDWTALRGHIVIVDFWALWCAPCREALPRLERLRKKHQSDGVVVIGVNLDENLEEVKAFLKERPVGFPVVHDPRGLIAQDYGVRRLPQTYLIDKKGVIRWIIEGTDSRDDKDVRESLEDMLKAN